MRTLPALLAILAGASAAAQMGNMGFGIESKFMMGMVPNTKKELKITKEQEKQLKDMMEKMNSDPRGLMAGGFDMVYMFKGMDAQFEKILTEEQKPRLKELWYQANGPMILRLDGPATEAGLDDDQKSKIKELAKTYDAEVMSTMQDQGKMRKLGKDGFKKIKQPYSEKIAALLTDAQKTKWTELQGKPFKF